MESPINNAATKTVIKAALPVKNEVVIILKDTTQNLRINYRTSSLEILPNVKQLNKTFPSLIIATDSIVSLRINHSYIYAASAIFYKGDTITVTTKNINFQGETISYPIFNSRNYKYPTEHNFNYYVSQKTPSFETYRAYSLMSKKYQWKHIATLEDTYKNIKNTADSLFKEKAISNTFYKTQLANAEILKAKYTKQDLPLDKTTDQSYSNNKYYIKYLTDRLLAHYNLNPRNNEQNFNYITKHDTLLNQQTKTKVLDQLLTSIYLAKKNSFPTYYKKFKDLKPSKTLISKYDVIIENDSINKKYKKLIANSNHKGELLSYSNDQLNKFEDVIKNNKGKIILVDFWASWCVPCRIDIPELKKMKTEFDTSEFIWVTISIDEDISAWKKAIESEDLHLKKENYILIDAKNSQLYKNFEVSSIPRYLIFDKEGKLLESAAPSVKDNQLKEFISLHLNNKILASKT
ncbi:hypothetical protein Y10_09820 [Neptunitalea sp. Y10]|uniref:Thioredoxin domain-containing protein n=1 Tax=Neptunitalea lumnitzerae TaxID=2965509 RepID=A0ABQ5MGT3_9FLAO|nr:hypothetical protein Y10_09820 [Neptunitalea sp. Y10]